MKNMTVISVIENELIKYTDSNCKLSVSTSVAITLTAFVITVYAL